MSEFNNAEAKIIGNPETGSIEMKDPDQPLTDSNLAGVGTLSEVMGVQEARDFIDGTYITRRYLRERSLQKWGLPVGHLVRTSSK